MVRGPGGSKAPGSSPWTRPWCRSRRQTPGLGSKGQERPLVDGVQGRVTSPLLSMTSPWGSRGSSECSFLSGDAPARRCARSSGKTVDWLWNGVDPLKEPRAGGMQRGRASGSPCQDCVVVQHTSCAPRYDQFLHFHETPWALDQTWTGSLRRGGSQRKLRGSIGWLLNSKREALTRLPVFPFHGWMVGRPRRLSESGRRAPRRPNRRSS